LWRFFDYVTEDGRNLIQDWYDALPVEAQVAFDVALIMLRGTEEWGFVRKKAEHFKVLDGVHVGLGEVRFTAELPNRENPKKPTRRKYRPVGVWPPEISKHFIMILGCHKMGGAYFPHAAFDVALRYREAYKSGRGGIVEHLIP
jgi:hypothetical protein